MSAFILSDLHFSTIAIYIHHLNDNIGIQELADKLKSINIDSVNYRYGEKTRKAKCKIIDNLANIKYNKYDIIQLIKCWSYQSCENGTSLKYLMMDSFLLSFFDNNEIELSGSLSGVWSI